MYDKKLAGKRLQECRKRKGVTQQFVGDCVGFSREKISNLETARNDICMTDAVLLCDYLGVSLNSIFHSREMNTQDFLVLANEYFSNNKISKSERKESLKSLFKYL